MPLWGGFIGVARPGGMLCTIMGGNQRGHPYLDPSSD